MNNKRSYLGALNAGRQRRPGPSLDQITQSLQNLESKLDRREANDDFGWGRVTSEPRQAPFADYGAAARHAMPDRYASSSLHAQPERYAAEARYAPQERYAAHDRYAAPEQYPVQDRYVPQDRHQPERHVPQDRYAAPPRPAPRAASPEPAFQAIARDLDRVRGQEDNVASVSKIAGELKGLRDELRQQMTSGLQREFETLRHQIGQAYAVAPTAAGAELSAEIGRISKAIHNLSERSDDKSINALRSEIEQVKHALDSLAREDTVRSVDKRWDEFDRRWSDFEHRVDARQKVADPAIAVLSDRLQAIGDAVNGLPESLSLRSLEDKVRTLAGAVDHFVRQQEAQAPEAFGMIEERLDEISRAIVASSAAAQASNFDPEPFQRIEARISALAQQIDDVAEDRPTAAMMEHLHQLTRRVDQIAAQGAMPDASVERLTRQIAVIAEKIDRSSSLPNADQLFNGIEQRFDLLSTMIERRQGDAIEHGNLMFRDLERRLEEVADRMDRRGEGMDGGRMMAAIDARFSALAERIVLPGESGEMIRGLEDRLESISRRIEEASAQFANMDPSVIRSLENQVAALTDHLNRPDAPLPEFDDVAPRLGDIERSIAGSRDAILEAAREAAESAVRSFSGSQSQTVAVEGLAQDMRALEDLTRQSDYRNNKTFEAIHDTLIKIVDRLGTLDGTEMDEEARRKAVQSMPTYAAKMELSNTPSIDPDRVAAPAMPRADLPPQLRSRSPAEAAAEAAMAAIRTDTVVENAPAPKSKSMLGGIARAISGRNKQAPAVGGAPVDPVLDVAGAPLNLDQPLDPKIANRPLEPGSGAPDLNAIMKRVRDERGLNAKPVDPDAAKSDFIAAARRAAQAAAAEAEVLKRTGDVSGTTKPFRFGDLTKARRKPVLMAAAAIMIALAGLQLGKAYLSGDQQAGDAAPEIAASELPAESAPTNAPMMSSVASDATSIVANASKAEAGAPSAAAESAAPMAPSALPAPDSEATEAIPSATDSAPTESAPDTATATAVGKPAVVVPGVPLEAGPVALREAAQAGDAKALFEVGSRYADGRGLKADMAQAAKWYEKSAELGFAPAQFRIGNFYEKGMGVERDIAKAKTWYQLSAAQGNASAMHNLAVLFAMGADGATDNESAARWFTAAADLGVKDSQFNLGILAAKGVGTTQSLEESYKWFALVAKAGDRDAAAKRDEIANSLRPEQLEKARATVDLWKAKPLDPEANTVEIPESWQESAGTTASIDMKKAIGNIQRILNKNGYEAGNADGMMGEKTKTAIIAFQKDNGLEPTGEVDEKLVRALIAKK